MSAFTARRKRSAFSSAAFFALSVPLLANAQGKPPAGKPGAPPATPGAVAPGVKPGPPVLPPAVQKAAEAFRKAVELHRARKAGPAINAYKEFLRLAAVAKLPPSATLPAYQNLAVLYQYQGDRHNLEDALRHIVQVDTHNVTALGQLASLAVERHAYPEAQGYAHRALALSPPPLVAAGVHFVLGNVAIVQNQPLTAEHEFAAVTRLAPNNPQGFYNYGLTLGKEKKYKQALAAMETTQKLAPNLPQTRPYIAYLRQQLHDRKGAIAAYDATLRQNPSDRFAAFNRALLLQQSGKNAEAITAYLQLLELTPDNIAAQINIGQLYFSIGNYLAAKSHYSRAAQIKPNDPRILYALALSEQQGAQARMSLPEREREYRLAETHFKLAQRYDPKNADLENSLAQLYERMNRYDDALALYHTQQAAHPDDPAIYRRIADVYTMQRKTDDILNTWKAYRTRKPEDPLSYDEAALILEAAGRREPALAERHALLALNPKPSVRAAELVKIGEDLALLKRGDEAQKSFQDALEVERTGAGLTGRNKVEEVVLVEQERLNAMRGLAGLAVDANKTEEAVQWLNQVKQSEAATAAKTNSLPPAETYNAIARAYEKGKRPDLALAEYRALAQARLTDPAPLAQIARLEDTQTHPDAAIAAYREAIGRSTPKEALDYRLQIAELYRKNGKLDDALAEFEATQKDYPRETRFLASLAETYQQKGQDDKALAVYETLERSQPGLTWIEDRKATILLRQKRYPEARALYEKHLERDPEDYQTYIDLQHGYDQDGKTDAYLPWLRAKLEKNPSRRTLMTVVLDEYTRQKKDAEGWDYLKGIADKHDRDKAVLLSYADVLARRGKGKETLPIYRRLAANAPNDIEAQVTLASQLDLNANTDEANKLFETLIARGDLTAVQRLDLRKQAAERYRNQNKTEDAIRQYREIVKATPESDAYPRAVLAYLLTVANRDPEAIPLYTTLLKRPDLPKNLRASFLDELGAIAEKQGRKPDAITQYQEALKSNPQDKKATEALKRLAAK